MSLIFIECCVVWIPGLCCVDSSRSAVLDLCTEKKSSWKMIKQHFTTFSVQTNIHMQIRVDGKVEWLLVTWGAVAGGRFMLHKTALRETWGWREDWDGSSSGTGNPAQSVWDPERSGVTSSGALGSSDVWVDFKACELLVWNTCRKSPAASPKHHEAISSVREIIFQLTDKAK